MITNTPSSVEGVFFVFINIFIELRISCKHMIEIEFNKKLRLKLTEKSEFYNRIKRN